MAASRVKTLSALLAVVILVGLAIWVIRSTVERLAARKASVVPSNVAVLAPAPEAESPEAKEATTIPEVVAGAAEPAASKAPSLLLKPNAAYARYLGATDPAAYFEQASKTGGPDDKYFASEALRLCANWVTPPKRSGEFATGLHRLRNTSDGPWKEFALGEVERCKGFQTMDVVLSAVAAIMRREAAETGSLPALAADLVNMRKRDARAAREAAILVLESRDAPAIANLWPYLAADDAPSRMTQINPVLRQSLERPGDAWTAMACENGLDCGPASPVMKVSCTQALRFSCKDASYADYMDYKYKFGGSDRNAVHALNQFYAEVLRAGEWKRLGLN